MKNILKQKFDNFEDEPDRDVWAAIEKDISPKQAPVLIFRNYMWAVAASIAVLLGIGYFLLNNEDPHKGEIVKKEQALPEKQITTPEQAAPEQQVVETEMPTSTPVTTVAQQNTSPTKAVQSVKKIKMPDGRTVIQKTETYIVQEKTTYEIEPNTHKEVPIAQSVEKQPVQSPTMVSPTEIRPMTSPAVANENPSQPWKVYNVPIQNTPIQKVKPTPKRKGQNTQLDLNDTNPAQLASFASYQLNKVANTPVKVNYKEDKKTNKVTYEIGFKDFKIVRKTKK